MKRIALLLACAFAAVSCGKEIVPDSPMRELTFNIGFIEKTSLSGSSVSWVEGDYLSVFYDAVNARFTASSSGTSTSISGTAEDAPRYTILYPYSTLASLEGEKVKTSIPITQIPLKDGYDPSADILLARAAKGADVTMYHACGLLQFSIASNDVSGIRISSTDGTGIAGEVTIEFNSSGIPLISSASEKSIAVQPLNAAAFAPGNYNVCLAPCSLSKLKIDIRKTNGTIGSYTSSSSFKITRANRTPSSTAFDALPFTYGDTNIGSIIRSDHPRIFFNASTIPAMRERANGVALSYTQTLLKKANRLTTTPTSADHGDDAANAALAYLITGESKYVDIAKAQLLASVGFYTDQTEKKIAVDWYAYSRIQALAAYDWIYNELTPAERQAIIVPLVQHVELVQGYSGLNIYRQPDGDKASGYYGMASMLWFSGLAAYNDGYTDVLAKKHLEKGLAGYKTLCQFRNDTAGDDGVLNTGAPNYSCGNYPFSHFNFFFSYEAATGENVAACYPLMALFPQWMWWTWIKDAEKPSHMRYAGIGDSYHGENYQHAGYIYSHLTNYVHFYKHINPDAARLAATLRHRLNLSGISDKMVAYPFLLDPTGEDDMEDDPRFDATTLKARYYETVGQVLMRSAWTTDATYITISLGNDVFNQHKHYDQNSFTIYRGDHLALDTGCRGNGEGAGARGDYNLVYYYSQSVAHNMVLIHKPGESVPSHWGDKLTGRYNYGGTRSLLKTKVLAFDTNDKFTYLASDATDLYNKSPSTKCSEAVRQFFYIYPDCLVIYDRVGATDASYRKEWLLHYQNQPTVSGNVTCSDTGFGSARLFCQTLLPEDAVLNIRGGAGQEYWAGENFPLEEAIVTSYANKALANGRGPYTGAWRLEVLPSSAAQQDRFLNVLNPCDVSQTAPIPASLEKTATQDGVSLTVGGVSYKIMFNRSGSVGGTVSIGGVEQPLSDAVMAQSGIMY